MSAQAVIDKMLEFSPGCDWLFLFRHGGFLKMPLGALGGANISKTSFL